MAEEIIELTPRELEDIKDTITFRVETTKTLKSVCRKIDTLKSTRDDVKSLKIHRTIQWGFISAIFLAIFTMPLWLTKAMLMVNK